MSLEIPPLPKYIYIYIYIYTGKTYAWILWKSGIPTFPGEMQFYVFQPKSKSKLCRNLIGNHIKGCILLWFEPRSYMYIQFPVWFFMWFPMLKVFIEWLVQNTKWLTQDRNGYRTVPGLLTITTTIVLSQESTRNLQLRRFSRYHLQNRKLYTIIWYWFVELYNGTLLEIWL